MRKKFKVVSLANLLTEQLPPLAFVCNSLALNRVRIAFQSFDHRFQFWKANFVGRLVFRVAAVRFRRPKVVRVRAGRSVGGRSAVRRVARRRTVALHARLLHGTFLGHRRWLRYFGGHLLLEYLGGQSELSVVCTLDYADRYGALVSAVVVRVAAIIEVNLIGHETRFAINTIVKAIYSVEVVVVFGGDRRRFAVVIAERPGRRYEAHVVLVDEVFEQLAVAIGTERRNEMETIRNGETN